MKKAEKNEKKSGNNEKSKKIDLNFASLRSKITKSKRSEKFKAKKSKKKRTNAKKCEK